MVVNIEDDDRFPPMAEGDVYVFVHDDGVISVTYTDGRAMQRPLAEVIETIHGAQAAGGTVWLTGPDTEIGRRATEAIAASDPQPIEPFTAPASPINWQNGARGFLAAARYGQDDVLDDLLARGVDLSWRDDLGNTALHSAAFGNNAHAVERLLDAGIDVTTRNAQGYTAEMIALAERSERLLPVFARDAGTVRFRRSHWLTRAIGLPAVILFTVALVAIVVGGGGPIALGLAPGIIIGGFAALGHTRYVPWGQAGSVVALDGTMLTVQVGALRRSTIDLTAVSATAWLGPDPAKSAEGIYGSVGRIAVPSTLGKPWTGERTDRIAADPTESAIAEGWSEALFIEYGRMWRDEVVPALVRGLVLGGAAISEGTWQETLNALAFGAELGADGRTGILHQIRVRQMRR